MRIIVVGLGVQGKKRLAIAGGEAVATVDPVHIEARFQSIEQVPCGDYDAALVCTPDGVKLPILRHLLGNGKHVLVEKPLLGEGPGDLEHLEELANGHKAVCYTAYNHRFEPHIVNLKGILDSGVLGRVYCARFFYGNGTARDVHNSLWRDRGFGVLPDLGSHLLDLTLFLFGRAGGRCSPWRADRFENRAYDRFSFGLMGPLPVDYEMSLVSWRNTFHLDVYGESGSAHLDCLCKWGPSTLVVRRRILPSGRPTEDSRTLLCVDPTWAAEYTHFKALCEAPCTNTENDVWIQSKLQELMAGPL